MASETQGRVPAVKQYANQDKSSDSELDVQRDGGRTLPDPDRTMFGSACQCTAAPGNRSMLLLVGRQDKWFSPHGGTCVYIIVTPVYRPRVLHFYLGIPEDAITS